MPQYAGCERVFGVGNVVTGQGNIRVSLVHSQKVTTRLIEEYVGVGEGDGQADFSAFSAPAEARGVAQAEAVHARVASLPKLSESQVAALEERVRALHAKVDYSDDYDAWIAKVTPPDLE